MSTGSTVVGIDVQILTGAVTVGLAGWTDTTGARAATPYRTGRADTVTVGLAGWTDTTGARAATPYRTDDTGTIAVGLP